MAAGPQNKRYAWTKRILAIGQLLVIAAFLGGMLWTADWWRGHLVAKVANAWAAVAAYVVALLLLYELVSMPLNFISGFVIEHRYRMSNQTLLGWTWELAKEIAVSLVLTLPLVEVVYWLLRAFPEAWWLLACGVWVVFTVVIGRLGPTLILPLFFKTEPLADEDLRDGIERLAADTGLTLDGVYRLNLSKTTKKANAALAGMGRTRRVLLGDTLLEKFSPAEILVVFAHELGHHVHRHIWKLLGLAAGVAFVGLWAAHVALRWGVMRFGFSGIADVTAFPLLCIVLGAVGLLLLPIQNACSRHMERQCDAFAIAKTQDADSFVSAMRKLAGQNLADTDPHPLVELIFYSHPPISKRIAAAQ